MFAVLIEGGLESRVYSRSVRRGFGLPFDGRYLLQSNTMPPATGLGLTPPLHNHSPEKGCFWGPK